MKKTLNLATLVLACCLAAIAQTGSSQDQTSPSSNPSSYPQDQSGIAAAQGSQANLQTSIQGCLSQSPEGNFMIADKSGNNFQLRGDSSQLSSNVGKEVRVVGTAMPNSGSAAGSMSSGSSQGTVTQFSVSRVHKIADTCATGSSTNQ